MMRAAAIVIILLSPVIKCFNPKSLNETKIMGVNILGNNYTTQERRSLSELSLVYYGGPVLSAIHVVPVFYNSLVLHQSEILNYYGALISGGDFIAFIDAEYGTQSGSKVNYGTVDSPRNLMLAQSEQSDEQIRAILVDMFSKDTPAVLPSPTANTVYAVDSFPFSFKSNLLIFFLLDSYAS